MPFSTFRTSALFSSQRAAFRFSTFRWYTTTSWTRCTALWIHLMRTRHRVVGAIAATCFPTSASTNGARGLNGLRHHASWQLVLLPRQSFMWFSRNIVCQAATRMSITYRLMSTCFMAKSMRIGVWRGLTGQGVGPTRRHMAGAISPRDLYVRLGITARSACTTRIQPQFASCLLGSLHRARFSLCLT